MRNFFIIAICVSLPNIVNAANLVQNGSFEDPVQAQGTFSINPSINGWDLVSGSGIEIRNDIAGTAFDGANYVELDSNSNSAIQQSIATVTGGHYELAFYYSPRVDQPASTNGISVLWNGNLLDEISAIGGTTNLWIVYTFSVTGTGNDILSFGATGISDSLGGNIDNVSLNAVPVPAALWLMVSGLVFLGLGSRRKSA